MVPVTQEAEGPTGANQGGPLPSSYPLPNVCQR